MAAAEYRHEEIPEIRGKVRDNAVRSMAFKQHRWHYAKKQSSEYRVQ